MRYMMLVYIDEQTLSESQRKSCCRESMALVEDLRSAGQYFASDPLYPTSTATSVRLRAGKRLITDGPFAETREQLGGYYLVDAKDLDEAIGIAARIPAARTGTVEIRPILDVEALLNDEVPQTDFQYMRSTK